MASKRSLLTIFLEKNYLGSLSAKERLLVVGRGIMKNIEFQQNGAIVTHKLLVQFYSPLECAQKT